MQHLTFFNRKNLHGKKTCFIFAPDLMNASLKSNAKTGGNLFSAHSKNSICLLDFQVTAPKAFIETCKNQVQQTFFFISFLSENMQVSVKNASGYRSTQTERNTVTNHETVAKTLSLTPYINKEQNLTKCQNEILAYTAAGLSVKEIANHTYRSFFTVQKTISNIKEKTGLQKATELVAYYFCQNFLKIEFADFRKQILSVSLVILLFLSEYSIRNEYIRMRWQKTATATTHQRKRNKETFLTIMP